MTAATLEATYEIEIDDNETGEHVIDMGAVALQAALEQLRESKPEERSEKARRYAVAITELEKVFAYYVTFVMDDSV